MKSKVLVKLVVVLIASAVILLLGTAKLPAGGGSLYSGLYGRSDNSVLKVVGGLGLSGLYGRPDNSVLKVAGGLGLYGRSNSSVYDAYGKRVKFDKSNPDLLSSFGLVPFIF